MNNLFEILGSLVIGAIGLFVAWDLIQQKQLQRELEEDEELRKYRENPMFPPPKWNSKPDPVMKKYELGNTVFKKELSYPHYKIEGQVTIAPQNEQIFSGDSKELEEKSKAWEGAQTHTEQ